MQTLEWTTRDRSEWGSGPWEGEPDKAQWTDEATGLPCLVVRGPSGALCGYVGVGPQHPWYRKDYSACTMPSPCGEDYCRHAPGHRLEVHGGITFADACHDASPENFAEFVKRWEQRRAEREAEALKYPQGDSARYLKLYEPLVGDYEKWRAHAEATSICHLTEPGDFEPAWWFGFDCAHLGDATPAYDWRRGRDHDAFYRTIGYVRAQCARLAAQLVSVGARTGRPTEDA